METASQPFHIRALAWLRERTVVEPGTPVASEDSMALLLTTREERPATALFDVGGLFVLAASAAMSVLAQQAGIDELARRMLMTGVVGTLVGGAGLLAFGWLVRSANRVPVAVRVHTGEPEPLRAQAIEDLRHRARDREAWVVAEHGFSTDALMAATRLGVRCFHARGPGIEEVARSERRFAGDDGPETEALRAQD
jgi:hypothetical protein